MLKEYYKKIIHTDNEYKKLLTLVKKFATSSSKILDVGCGYGRYLKPLVHQGYKVLGVEQNVDIVKTNRNAGFECVTPDEFQKNTSQYDVIILSHIIEHFNPGDLFEFLNQYLAKLNVGGYLIIATPLYSDYFYDDFDHVKPYHPEGLQMVFGGAGAQVQYYSNYQMTLRDLWFRKSPLIATFQRAKYFKSLKSRMLQIYDLLMICLFKASFGVLGRKDGWIGVFEKLENSSRGKDS